VKERVRITDVSPRDGLQNEAGIIPTADKVRLIELLCATGVDEIEVTSFVSPKWVPQLGDAEQVFATLDRDRLAESKVMLSALVPNEKGLAPAEEVHRTPTLLEKISVFTAASESFCKRNINATIAESINRFRPVVERAKGACGGPMLIRAYVSCAIACPFEGAIAPEKVVAVIDRLFDLGVDEIDLGDTIGAGTPENIRELLRAYAGHHRIRRAKVPLTIHLHDTFGRAADCVKVALDMGVRSFDGSVAGLGGCPYASKKLPDGTIQRAPGNISTELLVQTIEDAGYETGVDRDALAKAAAFAREIVAKSRAGA
jgi:hydroxymethylglutaryl-CoA lyase